MTYIIVFCNMSPGGVPLCQGFVVQAMDTRLRGYDERECGYDERECGYDEERLCGIFLCH